MEPPPTLASLEDVRALLKRLAGPDREAAARAAEREEQLTKPPGTLGRLEELAAWMAAWQGAYPPRADAIATHVFVGNHGVVARRVSAYPAEVTAQMVQNLAAGGAAINQIAAAVGARLEVVPLEIERPTADLAAGPAMSEEDCLRALAKGMAAAEAGTDLLCLGEMGIGNTTAAAALACGLFGGSAADWVGPGTGVDENGLGRKTAAVAAAMATHQGCLDDPLAALCRLGGRELAAVTGAVLAARLKRIPVLLDGYVVTAAAAVLEVARPGALDHCRLGHLSAEPGHRRLAARLRLRPLLDLGMGLGEGTGATLAAAIVKAAVLVHRGMATFAEAGVSGPDR